MITYVGKVTTCEWCGKRKVYCTHAKALRIVWKWLKTKRKFRFLYLCPICKRCLWALALELQEDSRFSPGD